MRNQRSTAEHQARLERQLAAFNQWKADMVQGIRAYQCLLNERGLNGADEGLLLFEHLEAMRGDRLLVALLAEHWRDQAELARELFLPDVAIGAALADLPRPARCPVELCCDPYTEQPELQLLPIESRLQHLSIGEALHDPSHWVRFRLDLDDADALLASLKELTKTRRLAPEHAEALGCGGDTGGRSELRVPAWRYARIFWPHAWLERGLVLLMVPGAETLQREAELALSRLPAAHAVLYVHAERDLKDAAVAAAWQEPLRRLQAGAVQAFVALLRRPGGHHATPRGIPSPPQCLKLAGQLGADSARVHGLALPIGEHLQYDALHTLHAELLEDAIAARHARVRSEVLAEVQAMVQATEAGIRAELDEARAELEQLREVRGKNSDVIQYLMHRNRHEQSLYLKQINRLNESRRILAEQAKCTQESINLASVDTVIRTARERMEQTWTTGGLKKEMTLLLDTLRDAMNWTVVQAEQTMRLTEETYRQFHEELGIDRIRAPEFSALRFSMELEQVIQAAEQYRGSVNIVLGDKHSVIERFFERYVQVARDVFERAQGRLERWLKRVMAPLVEQIRNQKQLLERRAGALHKIRESREAVEQRIRELEKQIAVWEQDRTELIRIRDVLNRRVPHEPVPEPQPAPGAERATPRVHAVA